MISYRWIALFALLTFGVGFSVGVISVEIVAGASDPPRGEEVSDSGGWSGRSGSCRREGKGKRGGRRSGRRDSSRLGPYVSSVRGFSEKLDLDQSQRDELDRVCEETYAEVTHLERSISNTFLEKREEVENLLTPDQREKLESLLREQWDRWRAERIERSMAWLRSETQLPEEGFAEIEAILQEYEESKGSYFRTQRQRETWPEREEMEAVLGDLKRTRDQALRPFLGEGEIEGLDRASSRSWRHR